jgi:thiamine-monophosphate kinase
MGAEPGEAYVAVGIPTDLDEGGCLELFDGIAGLAAGTGTTVAGGDVTRAPALTLAVAVVGHAPSPELLVTRGGAQPGDALVLTGEIGGAGAGLLLLGRPELAASLPGRAAELLRRRQLDPTPRLAAGQALAAAGARAMIDLSDGLGGDAAHLAEASGAGIRIDGGALPLAPGVAEIARAGGREPLELAASGGEDYELLAALPRERLSAAIDRIGEGGEVTLTRIGEVTDGAGVEIRLPGGEILAPAGFDQLG